MTTQTLLDVAHIKDPPTAEALNTLAYYVVNGSSGMSPTVANLTVTTATTLSAMTLGSVLFAGTAGLVSQDNSNLFWDATNHRLGIGSAVPDSKLVVNLNAASLPASVANTALHLGGLDATVNRFLLDSFGSNNNFASRRSNGTAAVPTALLAADNIATMAALGYGTTSYSTSARASIFMSAAENWTDANQGTFISFNTTPTGGSTTNTQRLIIDGNGRVGIGNLTAAQSQLHVGTTAATAQTFNTFTDASNYENAYMGDWGVSANVATYGTGKAGTGSTRNIKFVVGGANKLDYGITNGTAWNFLDHLYVDETNPAIQLLSSSVEKVGISWGNGSSTAFLDINLANSLVIRDINNSFATIANLKPVSFTTAAATAIPAGGTAGAGLMVSSTANFGVFFGSGAPSLSAAKGSLYLRSDGTGINDRMYVNTNGSTTWTAVVTVA